MRRLIALTLSMIAAGCGADTPDVIKGRWELFEIRCDGVVTAFPLDITGFRITYGENNTFESVLSGTSCPFMHTTGTYKRDGLTVTDKYAQTDCGVSCTIGTNPPCVGISTTASQQTYRINLPTSDVLQQGALSSTSFCPPSGPTLVIEEQYYRRLN